MPTAARTRLFELIFSRLEKALPRNGNIVELGIGPGHLADYLLKRLSEVRYCGSDFSSPMMEIARDRLQPYSSQVTYLQADLVADSWVERLTKPVHAIVSTWALHDLGSPRNIHSIYEKPYLALGDRGILLNGDFIKPIGAAQEFEGGRFPVAKHLELLDMAGFSNARCLSTFEEEIQNPTAAQDYVCMLAEKWGTLLTVFNLPPRRASCIPPGYCSGD